MDIRGYHRRKIFKFAASQSPSKSCHAAAAAVEETATLRLISRIILESVVNASSRRRRGLPMTSRDPQRCCEAVRSAILATAWLLVSFGMEVYTVNSFSYFN